MVYFPVKALRIFSEPEACACSTLQGTPSYFSWAYSDLAAIMIGMSGSASFHRVKKS